MSSESHRGSIAGRAAVSPISHLSDDILYDIFHCIASLSSLIKVSGKNHPSVGPSGSDNLIPVTHVCRYWRNLALASPHLWAFLHLHTASNVSMAREFLSRSADAPLSVKLRGPNTVWDSTEDIVKMARILASHSGRFIHLRISGFLPDKMAEVLEPFREPAPLLESLQLHTAHSSGMFHPAIFSGWIPALRYMSAVGITTPWLPYRDLVELRLSSVGSSSLKDILTTLRLSPKLKILTLMLRDPLILPTEDNSSLTVDALSNPPGPARLDDLKSLDLGSVFSSDDVLHLLSQLVFPPKTSTHLRFLAGPVTSCSVHISRYSSIVEDIAAGIESAYLQCLVSHGGMHSVILKSTDGSIELEWASPRATDQELSFERIGLASLPFPTLRFLSIQDYGYGLADSHWHHILAYLPGIESLEFEARYISHQNVASFFYQLAHYDDDSMLICPNLTHLVLNARIFTEVEVQFWKEVVGALSARAARGAVRLDTFEIYLRNSELAQRVQKVLNGRLVEIVGDAMVHASIRS